MLHLVLPVSSVISVCKSNFFSFHALENTWTFIVIGKWF